MHQDYTSVPDADCPTPSAEHDITGETPHCGQQSPGRFRCTRDDGHDGPHEAAGGVICAVWDDDRTTDDDPKAGA